jgi:hypothetical protein
MMIKVVLYSQVEELEGRRAVERDPADIQTIDNQNKTIATLR